jgi:inorganic pyrophosphatase/exopolyphosphatase
MNSTKLSYLHLIRQHIFKNQSSFKSIYFILNNSSCDMDSFLSSYLLSFARNFLENIIIASGLTQSELTSTSLFSRNLDKIYIPLMNCNRGELKMRLDIAFLMKNYNIPEDEMFYINDEDVKKELSIDFDNKIKIILVDHNLLNPDQEFLLNKVEEIYDHHNDNYLKNNYYPNLKKKTIKYPLGSCTTLILADYFLGNKLLFENLTNLIDPLLLVTGILQDTNNFSNGLYQERWVDFDHYVFSQIISKIQGDQKDVNVKVNEYYKKLEDSKYEFEGNLELGINNLMEKDKKVFKWGDKVIQWSSLQISVKSIAKKYGWGELINHFYDIFNGLNFIITLSNYKDSTEKILLIFDINNYFNENDNLNKFKIFLTEKLNDKFIGIKSKKSNSCLIKVIIDPTLSRKLLEPILKDFFIK